MSDRRFTCSSSRRRCRRCRHHRRSSGPVLYGGKTFVSSSKLILHVPSEVMKYSTVPVGKSRIEHMDTNNVGLSGLYRKPKVS